MWQGVVLDRPITLACQTEGETTSWSDVSVTSGATVTSWQEEEEEDQSPDDCSIRKVVSSTSTGAETAVTDNVHHHRYRRHNKVLQNSLRTKNQRKSKKQSRIDSNEDLVFKVCFPK